MKMKKSKTIYDAFLEEEGVLEAKQSDSQDILADFLTKYVDGYGSVGIENPKQYAKVLIDIIQYIENDAETAIASPEDIFGEDVDLDAATKEMERVLALLK
jgi:hypothetical protein